MSRQLLLLMFGCLLLAAPLHAQDEMEEKIRLLEQQIQDLKALKARQAVSKQKAQQCMQTVGREKFCTCVAENLPVSVMFEQYVHIVVTSKEELGYNAMPPEQKKLIDAVLETRAKCVEKGFFD